MSVVLRKRTHRLEDISPGAASAILPISMLVLIIAMGIGGFMPLAGVGFYVCCAIMRSDVERASRAMLPYLIMVLIGLLIVAFVPWFALFLPRYFGFRA